LQVHLDRRFSHGLSLSASYTDSLMMATIAGESDPRYSDRGPTNYDAPNVFVVSPIWQLPIGKGWLNTGGVLNQIAGGWQLTTIISARSGFPFTPTLSGTNVLNDTYKGFDLPQRICSGLSAIPRYSTGLTQAVLSYPLNQPRPARCWSMETQGSTY